jgi:flavorubredoxin
MIVNTNAGSRIDEIADRIFRISIPVPPAIVPGGFTFNQYLIDDEAPLLFHTGMKDLFPLVSEAIATVMPLSRLRYIGFSHVEADECGALNTFLAAASGAEPIGSRVSAMISMRDNADRPVRGLNDGEVLSLGRHEVMWVDSPHVPHNWETGFLHERTTGTFLCGDLFTHAGSDVDPVTSDDLVERAESMRRNEPATGLPPSYSLGTGTGDVLGRLAKLRPTTLAVMHGSAWSGTADEGAAMIERLADRLAMAVAGVA